MIFTYKQSSLTHFFIFIENNKIDGLLLNKNNFENFIRDLLLVKQYRVEVYVNQGTAKSLNWVLEYKGSPGNLSQFEDLIFGGSDVAVESSVMAVKLGTESASKVNHVKDNLPLI